MIVIPIWRRLDLVLVRPSRGWSGQFGHRSFNGITRVFLNYVNRDALVICPGYGLQWVGAGGSCAFIWTHWTALSLWWSDGLVESRKTDPVACFPMDRP